METVNQMVSRTDPETMRLLNDVILLAVPANPLQSGWAWGQQYLQGGTAVAEASVGEGKVILLGPEVTFRGQPHATFKFLFNGVYYGSATQENSEARTGGF
jgi:hypothetical protein